MDGGIPFFDLLFFAMVAAFLVFRLRSVLGRRQGHHQAPPQAEPNAAGDANSNDNVIALPDRNKGEDEESDGTPLGDGIRQIRGVDASFEPELFASGARAAFEMIVNAFAGGDRDTLRPLTSAEVFGNFERTIADREEKGHILEATLIGIKEAELTDAGLDGHEAWATVRFVSEQVGVLRDSEGQTLSGATNAIEEITDVWTFARDTRSPDPNWRLVATGGES
jgi:predicted lipid-binding transport protein (Tim44 family)